MKLQAEMQEAKLQALKVANKSRQTAAIQVRYLNFLRKSKFVFFYNNLSFEFWPQLIFLILILRVSKTKNVAQNRLKALIFADLLTKNEPEWIL